MKSLTNVWIVVENWHSMARVISIFMSYAKDVVLVSIMTKSLVTKLATMGLLITNKGWKIRIYVNY
jgi:hypothetical protein